MLTAVTATTGPALSTPTGPSVVDGLSWIGIVLAGLLVMHTFAVWAEKRGWIHYRRSGGGAGRALSNAMSTFDAVVNPASEHLYEEQKSEQIRGQVDESGHLILDSGHEFVLEREPEGPDDEPDGHE